MPHRSLFRQIKKQHSACLYYIDTDSGEKIPKVCNLHDVFNSTNPNAHNCLGCNLADLTNAFEEVLKGLQTCKDLQAAFSTYFLWLNVFIERYSVMMNYLGVPLKLRQRDFPAFSKIKHWANFQKHPKAFLFVHHPEYFCISLAPTLKKSWTQIDQTFVDKYYSGDKHNDSLWKELINKQGVAVVYPDPRESMNSFAEESQKFMALIQNNPVYRELLSEVSTALDYFNQENEI
jgi:hypothetical protein